MFHGIVRLLNREFLRSPAVCSITTFTLRAGINEKPFLIIHLRQVRGFGTISARSESYDSSLSTPKSGHQRSPNFCTRYGVEGTSELRNEKS
jgi:hypothetical protein